MQIPGSSTHPPSSPIGSEGKEFEPKLSNSSQWPASVNMVLAALAGLCSAVLFYAFFFPPERESGDLLYSPNPFFLGEISEGNHESQFSLRNNSGKPIILHTVERMCRCSNVVFSKKRLDVKEEAVCNFSWNTSGLRGPSATSFVVYFSFENDRTGENGNATGLQSTLIEATAIVAPTVSSSINEVDFQGNESSSVDVHFSLATNNGENPKGGVVVKSATVDGKAFDIQMLDDDSIQVSYSPNKRATIRTDYDLVVDFTSPEGYSLSLPVTVTDGAKQDSKNEETR